MSDNKEILSDEEIEALSEGVASGQVEVENSGAGKSTNAVQYDFHQPAHILKARLPALDMINERFAKYYGSSLFTVLHRLIEIETGEVELIKYADYINSVPNNASLNKVKANELHSTMLFSFDAKLVYLIVDFFFGGAGIVGKIEEDKELSPTEMRVVERVLSYAFNDLKSAWKPVSAVSFEYLHAESRTQISNFADPAEVVVLSKFTMKFNDLEGEFHIVIPYSALEPLRPILASGARKEQVESDDSWRVRLKERLSDVAVEVNAIFTETNLTLNELLALKPGDFIPISMKDTTTVCSNDIPLFEGKIGMSNRATAVRVMNWNFR